MKIAYITPWFKTNPREAWFQVVWDFFESRWIKPVFVDIEWERKTMKDYVRQFKEKIISLDDEIYVLWFSFWAMVACIAASELDIEAIFLCSLSPFFSDDLPNIKKWWMSMNGKRRNEEFRNLSFDMLSSNINCKTYILAWDKEWPEIMHRATEALRLIKWSELHVIENTRHNINERRYLETLEYLINKL